MLDNKENEDDGSIGRLTFEERKIIMVWKTILIWETTETMVWKTVMTLEISGNMDWEITGKGTKPTHLDMEIAT